MVDVVVAVGVTVTVAVGDMVGVGVGVATDGINDKMAPHTSPAEPVPQAWK